MRPLVVFSGQGVARADGFNLTRRAKALPEFRALLPRMERADRQNLDALLRTAVESGAASSAWISGLRALCLKERRTTLRKLAHRGVFEAIAAAAKTRLVVHLTANVDGLTTTFLVRDFRARWAPFHGLSTLVDVRRDVVSFCSEGRGILHFPVHGEVGLYVSESDASQYRTAYHHPNVEPDGTVWVSSLAVGAGGGLQHIETNLPSSRLALALAEGLLQGGEIALEGVGVGDFPPADLLVIGYGAHGKGARPSHPFERLISEISSPPGADAGSWRALVYGPTTSRHVTDWFADHGFSVVLYGDEELPTVAAGHLRSAAPTGAAASQVSLA